MSQAGSHSDVQRSVPALAVKPFAGSRRPPTAGSASGPCLGLAAESTGQATCVGCFPVSAPKLMGEARAPGPSPPSHQRIALCKSASSEGEVVRTVSGGQARPRALARASLPADVPPRRPCLNRFGWRLTAWPPVEGSEPRNLRGDGPGA